MRILVVRFSSIGDIVLCSPILRLLKSAFPNCSIDFLTKQRFANILDNNPYLENVYCWESKESFNKLKRNNYSLIVDLHSNLRSLMVKALFWHVPAVSLSKKSLQKWLYVKTKWSIFRVTNIVEREVDLLKVFDIQWDGLGLDIFPSNETFGLDLPKEYVVLALGGTYKTKQMPLELVASIIQNMIIPVVLIGGEAEKGIADNLSSQFSKETINLTGQLSILDSAKIMKAAKWVYSGDTGMAHIAAAVGTNLTIVWGNTSTHFGMVPPAKFGKVVLNVEAVNLSFHPCSKLGFDDCPKGHFQCMKGHKGDRIVNMMEKSL
jgi:ADP-heptose:LPS heptosyltransferase